MAPVNTTSAPPPEEAVALAVDIYVGALSTAQFGEMTRRVRDSAELDDLIEALSRRGQSPGQSRRPRNGKRRNGEVAV
jgi:hypothetical protein